MYSRTHLPAALLDLAQRQDGILTRAQLSAGGVPACFGLRTSAWQAVTAGLYSLGEPTWSGVARAALLRGGSAAVLGDASAAFLHGLMRDPPQLVTVWLPHGERRAPFAVAGTAVVFRQGLRSGHGDPVRTSVEETILDVAAVCAEDDVVSMVTRALAQRRTTAARVLDAMTVRRRVARRALLLTLLDSASQGIESALEWRFDAEVIRAHGLPVPRRQVQLAAGRCDLLFEDFSVIAELDGVRDHADWNKDMLRDNEHVVDVGAVTLRYGWRATLESPCLVAAQLGRALVQRGWTGLVTPCLRCPS